MKTEFEKFIEKNYKGLNFISIPNESFRPGVILNDDDRIIDDLSRIFPDEKKWKIKSVAANLADQTINGERGLDLGVKVLGIVGLKGGAKTGYSVTFEFNDVSQVMFDTENGGAYENEVRTMIRKIKDKDRMTWQSILHQFVVLEVVIVKTATIEFKKDGKALGEVEIKKLENEFSIDGSYEWKSGGKMVIKNEKNLPFGVLGFQVKRQM